MIPAALLTQAAVLGAGPLAPPWAVFPMAMVTMVVITAHLRALARAQIPASRRRIRIANAWLMMFLTIALACAFGVASSSNPRLFVMTWMTVAGLTGLVLLLAWIDAFNSVRLHRRDREQLRGQMRELLAPSASNVPTPDDNLRLAEPPSPDDRDPAR